MTTPNHPRAVDAAKLAGVPLYDELSVEFPIGSAVPSEVQAHVLLCNHMAPQLEIGEFYAFRVLAGDEKASEGDVVAAYVTAQHSHGETDAWERCVAVVRRYSKDAATGMLALHALDLTTPVVYGLDAEDAEYHLDESRPPYGITVFAILHSIEPARNFVQMTMKRIPTHSPRLSLVPR